LKLDWPGVHNARDLGGLPAAGGTTRAGALVRSDSLQALPAAGWDALLAHGVRTVVDLRNDEERGTDAAPRPAAVTTLHVPLDGWHDREFWDVWASGPQFGTPLYYGPHLERHPDRSAAAVAAIATAPPGGVAFHCQGGRDRSGQVAMLVLALLGVPAAEIAADYARSEYALTAAYAVRGVEDDGPRLAAFLADRGTTAERVIENLLAEVDVEAALRGGGLDDSAIAALRARAVG
jgi:hypothetical protein